MILIPFLILLVIYTIIFFGLSKFNNSDRPSISYNENEAETLAYDKKYGRFRSSVVGGDAKHRAKIDKEIKAREQSLKDVSFL